MAGTLRGYCNTCNKEYANIYQHKKTKMHKHRVEQLENEVLEKNNRYDEDMPDIGEPGAVVQEDTMQTGIEEDSNVRVEDEPEVQPQKEVADTKIQITVHINGFCYNILMSNID